MNRSLLLLAGFALLLAAPATAQAPKPEATSLSGKPLYSNPSSADALAKYEAAKKDYEADPKSADKLIWYGRRTAYLGRFNDAIAIFSEGVKKFPADARILRHRGHRYLTTRQFDKAIADLTKAHAMIAGKKDEVEPDGAPNAQNIPVSTLNGNIRYHLALAYYLKHDWAKAKPIYEEDLKAGGHDDQRIADSYWYYSALRRMGQEKEAAAFLKSVPAKLNLIEGEPYMRVMRLARHDIIEAQAMGDGAKGVTSPAVAYGIANWHLYTGDKAGAEKRMRDLVAGKSWGDFGFTAAEADLAAGLK